MPFIIGFVQIALLVFFILLFCRVVTSFIAVFARDWKPKGLSLIFVEGVLSATDPPIRFLRRHLPEIRLGDYRLDLSVMILMILVSVAISLLSAA